MPQVVWTQRAVADLDRLRWFLFKESPPAAQKALERIRREVDLLGTAPGVGRPASAGSKLRELIVPFGRNADIVLYCHESSVEILRIRHSRELGY